MLTIFASDDFLASETFLASEAFLNGADDSLPSRTCARNTRSKSLVVRCWAFTLIYFGGAGNRGMNPTG